MVKKLLLVAVVGILIFVILMRNRDVNRMAPTGEGEQFTISEKSCPDPFVFQMPVDMSKVTSILYPGQYRSGGYKAHGGFRFDNSRPDEISVIAPYDAEVTAGARYPVEGQLQYTFDFSHPCGIRYRFGHLLTLTPKFQEIAEKFPLPKTVDSRTTQVYPPIKVKQGEVIATAVGLADNPFVDWGVYDYRQKNKASNDAAWSVEHSGDTEQHAVCWFDWISYKDREFVLSLPSSDGQSGKSSDYCK